MLQADAVEHDRDAVVLWLHFHAVWDCSRFQIEFTEIN